MASMYPRAVAHGDAGLSIEFGDRIDPVINARVLALDKALAAASIPGVTETVPTYRALLVNYDPVVIGHDALQARVLALAATEGAPAAGCRRWTVPVAYGGPTGIDLEAVAERTGLSPTQVVDLHAGREYRIYMLGFQPGFAYLGELDPRLASPRRPAPRPGAPPGTISLGGQQTAIQTVSAPSGWHWIGRTPIRNYRPEQQRVFIMEPGDLVRFHPISANRLVALERAAAAGEIVAELEVL